MFRMFVRVCAATALLCGACSGTQPVTATSPVTAAQSVAAPQPAGALQPATAPQPAGGALLNTATITQSASTNTPGIVIVARQDTAHWKTTQLPGRGQRLCREDEGEAQIGAAGKTLLEDIPSDVRLADLPVGSCSKPASFGTTTTLEHFLDRSGDLSCPGTDPRVLKLARDVEAVKRAVLAACQ